MTTLTSAARESLTRSCVLLTAIAVSFAACSQNNSGAGGAASSGGAEAHSGSGGMVLTTSGGGGTGGLASGGTSLGGTVASSGSSNAGAASGGASKGGAASGGASNGGALASGGSAAVAGASPTAGVAGLGAGASGAGSAGAENHFSFFAFGDAHAGQNATANATLRTAMLQMAKVDPGVAFGVNDGDLVEDSTAVAWRDHDTAVMSGNLHSEATSFGGMARYLAVVDNHDLGFPFMKNEWLMLWNQHLPGQVMLGHNADDGVYYSFSYQSTLFIALDSVHPSAAQDDWLASVLASPEAQSARVRIAIFHEPVYICSTEHPPFAGGVRWVDSFEKNRVKLVFTAHTHVYERTCPLLRGRCSTDPSAIVFQGVGPVAANNFRTVDVKTAKVSGKDAANKDRVDDYSCSGDASILRVSKVNTNTFCHVQVDGCRIIGACYEVSADNPQAFDSWEVNGCG